MPWSVRRFEGVDELLGELLQRSREISIQRAWRGEARPWPNLSTTLDRLLPAGLSHPERLKRERVTIDWAFEKLADLLGWTESNEILFGSHGEEPLRALIVMQHYGVPTRLLDWTRSAWVAAYFAAWEAPDEDGSIWSFEIDALSKAAQVPKDPAGAWRLRHSDLHQLAFSEQSTPWVHPVLADMYFPRLEAQQGMFTIAGRLGEPHDRLIGTALGSFAARRYIIPAKLKVGVIMALQQMNVHASSLLFPAADIVARRLVESMIAEKAKYSANAPTSPCTAPAPRA